jgi:hypothetical protein
MLLIIFGGAAGSFGAACVMCLMRPSASFNGSVIGSGAGTLIGIFVSIYFYQILAL